MLKFGSRRFVGAFKNIVQAGMMPFWDVNPYYVDNEMSSLQSPYMKIETWFKNYDQKMDMRMETSQGVNEIKDFSLPYNWQQVAFPFSLRSGGNSNWLMDYLFYDSKIMGKLYGHHRDHIENMRIGVLSQKRSDDY